jgi:hypothetical protein
LIYIKNHMKHLDCGLYNNYINLNKNKKTWKHQKEEQ